MKTLFFGTSDFAVPILRAVSARTNLRGVVTQPDRPAGRGHKLQPTPVKRVAHELGVAVQEPRSLRDFAQTLAEDDFDLFVLASYGRILPKALLDVPKLGALNVHPSLLPRYRGATPIQSALRSGDSETGVTIMLMDAGMDTGDVVLQERTPIRPGETYGELHDRLAVFGAQVLGHAIDLAHSGFLPHEPQSGEPSTTRPLGKDDLAIDWGWPAQRIVDTVRALSPAPAARAAIGGVCVKLLRAHPGRAAALGLPPGAVLGVSGDAISVACGDGSVAIETVIAPSHGVQKGAAFAQTLAARAP